MERIKALNKYQKAILIIVTVMVIVFAPVYKIVTGKVGLEYNDKILVPTEQNGNTIYSGKIAGQQAVFTVTADKVVEFRHGDKLYGPYTATEDPTAIPEDDESAHKMTGVELKCGDKIVFRGGARKFGDYLLLVNEDGTTENLFITFTTGTGERIDADGNVIDPLEPSISTVLSLMSGEPDLTNKGDWTVFFYGLLLCLLTAVSILYVDEMFRWNLSFQIRNVEKAEPSDWEIAGRYIGWTVLPIMSLVIFIIGLQ